MEFLELSQSRSGKDDPNFYDLKVRVVFWTRTLKRFADIFTVNSRRITYAVYTRSQSPRLVGRGAFPEALQGIYIRHAWGERFSSWAKVVVPRKVQTDFWMDWVDQEYIIAAIIYRWSGTSQGFFLHLIWVDKRTVNLSRLLSFMGWDLRVVLSASTLVCLWQVRFWQSKDIIIENSLKCKHSCCEEWKGFGSLAWNQHSQVLFGSFQTLIFFCFPGFPKY